MYQGNPRLTVEKMDHAGVYVDADPDPGFERFRPVDQRCNLNTTCLAHDLYENRSNYLIIFMLRCARNHGHGRLLEIGSVIDLKYSFSDVPSSPINPKGDSA